MVRNWFKYFFAFWNENNRNQAPRGLLHVRICSVGPRSAWLHPWTSPSSLSTRTWWDPGTVRLQHWEAPARMLTPRPALLQHRGASECGNAAGARSPPLPGLLQQEGCAVVPSPRTSPLSHSQPAKDMAKSHRCFQTGTRVELLLQQRSQEGH